MTLEELQAKVDELNKSIEAVNTKNKELLNENRTLKVKAKGAEIDPEEFTRLQSENESLSEQLTKVAKTSKADLDKLTKSLSERDASLSNLLIDSGIAESLAKGGVAPHYIAPLKAMFKQQAALKTENGQTGAFIGDKSIADVITGYLGGDEGKHFVSAPGSSGGGAQGGGHKPSAATNRSKMDPLQKAAFIEANGSDAYLALPN